MGIQPFSKIINDLHNFIFLELYFVALKESFREDTDKVVNTIYVSK